MATTTSILKIAGLAVGAATAVGILIYLDRQMKRTGSKSTTTDTLASLCTTPGRHNVYDRTRAAVQKVGVAEANAVLSQPAFGDLPSHVYAAIVLGKVDVIRALLDTPGIRVNLNEAQSPTVSSTSVFHSVTNGNVEMARLLLGAGDSSEVAPLTDDNKRAAFIGACLAATAGRRSTRAAPRGPLHGGRSTRAAPRGSLHGGVADLFLY